MMNFFYFIKCAIIVLVKKMEEKDLLNKIKQYQTICIFGHISPDGDCYGAQTSLKSFIKEIYPHKDVFILGSGFTRAIPYFDKMDVVEDNVFKEALAILVDCSDLERVEDKRINLCKEICKIDHHLGSEEKKFSTINISNIKACSASQMVGEFIINNGYTLSKNVAERIFLGIITDSNRFQYLSSCKNLFLLMDKIMLANIDYQKIYDFLYESDERSTRAKGYISYYFKTYKKIAYIILDKKTLKKLNINYNYASSLVNCLSLMKEYPVWVSFAENEDGLIRVEMRSKSFDVQQVAILYNGGGHLNASGCRLSNINECMNLIYKIDELMEDK